jgi:hypothetical protein
VVRLAPEQSDDTVELLVGEAERTVDCLSDGEAQVAILVDRPAAPGSKMADAALGPAVGKIPQAAPLSSV